MEVRNFRKLVLIWKKYYQLKDNYLAVNLVALIRIIQIIRCRFDLVGVCVRNRPFLEETNIVKDGFSSTTMKNLPKQKK
jgi:hypothetical protein